MMVRCDGVDWAKNPDGLVPAVVQDAFSGRVLMLGYMNQAALEQTLQTGDVTFYSRSRKGLWTKGETSGHRLQLKAVEADCDRDALLVQAQPMGPTCHRNTVSCFGDSTPELSLLAELEETIAARDRERPEGSYTTTLFDAGVRRIAQKVGEEAVELALAAVAQNSDEMISESADLVFHLLVLLRARGVTLNAVIDELSRRR